MVDPAAIVSLGTLRDLLIDEVKFVSGVGDGVNQVESDLRSIHAMLMEADAKRSRSESPVLKEWMAQLKELAYRAENVLEKYAFEVQSKRQGKGLKKKFQRFVCILGEWCSVREVGNEIINIRSRLTDLTAELRSISGEGEGPSNSADQERRRRLRLRYAHEVDHHFVGMRKEIDDLVSMVKDDSPQSNSVISICGMGGLGKTTLARKIYNHSDIQRCFQGRAWVCVTQQCQEDTILRDIFKQIDGNNPDKDETFDGLVRGLYNILEKKDCLIVIDDIWEADHWNILEPAFPTKNCKVLITTRNENVITSHEHYLHKLRFLSEDEGWELLHKIAFPTNGDETQGLQSTLKPFEGIGRKMVQKCGCLPLAISVIGGILSQKRQILVEWEEVSSKIDGIKRDKRVEQILDLSFHALPYYLKPCFLYLACFPEDKEIDTNQLYMLWMAEGLISQEEKGNHESLRDVAERYLSELAFRCMVQVKSHEFNIPHKKFESCRLHDLMHDLCSSKAEEENFIKRVDMSQHHQDIPSSIGASIHRLAINAIDVGVKLNGECLHKFKDLRSFLVLGNYSPYLIVYAIMVNFESCKSLRVLSLEGLSIEDGEIPSRIGKLINSRTACIEDIINLRNLRRLEATIEGDEECLSRIVDYMSNHGCPLLETDLTIESCNLRDVVEKMSMIPSLIWLKIQECEIGRSFPIFHNLVFLTIKDCEIEGDVMDVLGKFPMLQVLQLWGERRVKTELMILDANSFPELKELYLFHVEGLRKLRECRKLEKLMPTSLTFPNCILVD